MSHAAVWKTRKLYKKQQQQQQQSRRGSRLAGINYSILASSALIELLLLLFPFPPTSFVRETPRGRARTDEFGRRGARWLR